MNLEIIRQLSLADLWATYGPALVGTLVVVAVGDLVWRVVRRAGRRWVRRLEERAVDLHDRERAQRLATLWQVAAQILRLTILVVVAVSLAGLWGLPIAPFIALGSAIAVAVGFGAQDLVKDVIAGIFIILEDQYAVGDVVKVVGVAGAVEEIRLRVTVLRDLDGQVHYVPNGEIRVATNVTQRFSRMVVTVGVGYGEDVDRVLEVVRDEAERFADDWSERMMEPPQILGVDALSDWSVDVKVVFTTVPEGRWAVKREFLRRIKNRLDAEGIEIPFPYRTVVLRRDDDAGS